MASIIRWKHGDYISLGKAVSQFNKKINELEKEGKKLYLPEKIDYKQARENIISRQELNRLINSLKRFQRENAEDIYTTERGEQITKWERRELGIQSRIITRRLNKELKELSIPINNEYSKAQMGSVRVREINAQIKNLKSLENKVGYEFRSLKRRISNLSSPDYTLRGQITYRNNYIATMRKYSHFDNYDKLVKLFNKLKNPKIFYEYMAQNELTVDLTYQSDQYYSQQAFNQYLVELGINLNEDSIS